MSDDFLGWVSRGWRSVAAILSLAASIIEIASHSTIIAEWIHGAFPHIPQFGPTSDALQCVAMLILLVPCFSVVRKLKAPGGASERRKLATTAAKQFWQSWVWLVAVWLFFYLALLLRQTLDPSNNILWGPAIDALNNLQGALLFVCYWHMTGITIREPSEGDGDSGPSEGPPPSSLLFVSLALFFVADLVATLHTGRLGDPIQPVRTRMLFQLLSGLWVGVSLGLVTGCLESEYFNVDHREYLLSRRIVISSLYLYAVLQVAYVGFGITQSGLGLMEAFATVLSLPLKVLFILFCSWMLQSHRLEFYMMRTRETILGIDKDWN